MNKEKDEEEKKMNTIEQYWTKLNKCFVFKRLWRSSKLRGASQDAWPAPALRRNAFATAPSAAGPPHLVSHWECGPFCCCLHKTTQDCTRLHSCICQLYFWICGHANVWTLHNDRMSFLLTIASSSHCDCIIRPLRSFWSGCAKTLISKPQISHSVEQPEAHLQETRESAQDSPRHNKGELVLPRVWNRSDRLSWGILASIATKIWQLLNWLLSVLVRSCQYSLHETHAAYVHGENLFSFWKDKKVYTFYDQKDAKQRINNDLLRRLWNDKILVESPVQFASLPIPSFCLLERFKIFNQFQSYLIRDRFCSFPSYLILAIITK